MVLFTYPSSVTSALNNQLLILFVWKYICSLADNICFLFIEEGGGWFHGLGNQGITTASAKSHREENSNVEEGAEDVCLMTRETRAIEQTRCSSADREKEMGFLTGSCFQAVLESASCSLSPV